MPGLMDKSYTPENIEARWTERWEADGHFAADPNAEGTPYCIMLPPPNVTGSLHMGHAFQHSIMDALTRYHRMKGDNTLWQPGTDHAGIATQMVVERQLAARDIHRRDLGRDAFLDKVWEWKAESGGTITGQMRRLGASVDWQRERFTMDEGLSQAVTHTFVKLHEQGLIYRGKRLVNWDPVLHTAISDLEVEASEEAGHLWHFRYPLADGSGHLTVATTRPETMLGDSGVAVHPDDERYQSLIGKTLTLPLTGREIPIVADAHVDPEFGTGCVKVTPAHDFNDYAIGERHGLAKINILTEDAHINDNAPSAYRGMDRYEARERIVADLDAAGLLDKVEDHRLTVPRGDRSGAVIEPFLTDQWFVKADILAEKGIEVVRNGQLKFVPENWSKTYLQWLENIEDWCISRQLWWGHRIPAWYDSDGNHYVGESEAAVRAAHGLGDRPLHQDEDVLDTWFSSALWPFSTLGWPEQTEALKTWYPTSVLVTGFDIIFFWVARMVMMGLHFIGEVPFREVYITGLIRDAEGQKMSKSKGNILDPLDIIDGISLEALLEKRTQGMMQPQLAKKIEKQTRKEFPDGIAGYGTDALRFTFMALASTGRDIRFDMGRCAGYRNFCNKLWNASRYVLMNTEGEDCGTAPTAVVEYSLADRWAIGRLHQTAEHIRGYIEEYRFDLAAKALYEFVWNEFCDWYLELSKVTLNNPEATPEQRRGTRQTLVNVLENLLRLAHPFIPFITEEIWQKVAPLAGIEGATIMRQPYPEVGGSGIFAPQGTGIGDNETGQAVDWVRGFIEAIRNIRGEMNIAPRKPLPILLRQLSAEDQARLQQHRAYLDQLAVLESITILGDDPAPECATALLGEMQILVPMKGLIDKTAELARLGKNIEKMQKDIGSTQGKLANPQFVERAPAAVVDTERERLANLQRDLKELLAQQAQLESL